MNNKELLDDLRSHYRKQGLKGVAVVGCGIGVAGAYDKHKQKKSRLIKKHPSCTLKYNWDVYTDF